MTNNLSIKIDLMKLNGACLSNLKGASAVKKCLIIPIDDSNLYVGEKGVYLNCTGFAMREIKYEQTHIIKQSIDGETYKSMSDEDRNAMPIIGGVKPFERKEIEATNEYEILDNIPDDLPF